MDRPNKRNPFDLSDRLESMHNKWFSASFDWNDAVHVTCARTQAKIFLENFESSMDPDDELSIKVRDDAKALWKLLDDRLAQVPTKDLPNNKRKREE